MNGNDRVLWWAYSQFMQYRNFNMIRYLAHGSPISPLLQIYLKVNFIPAKGKLKFTETQLFSFKKIKKSLCHSYVALWESWQSGLPCLPVCYTSVYCKAPAASASHLRGEGLATSPYTIFEQHIFADFQYDSFGKSVWQTLLHCVLHKTCSYSQTLPQTKYHEVSLI